MTTEAAGLVKARPENRSPLVAETNRVMQVVSAVCNLVVRAVEVTFGCAPVKRVGLPAVDFESKPCIF